MQDTQKVKQEKQEKKQVVLSSKNITVAEMKAIINKVRAFHDGRSKAENDSVKDAYLASLCPNPEDLIKLLAVYEELFPNDEEGIKDLKEKLEEEYKKKAKFMGVLLFMIADSLKSIYKKAFKNYVRTVNKENKLAQQQAEELVRAKGEGLDEFGNPRDPRARGRFGRGGSGLSSKKEAEYEKRISDLEREAYERDGKKMPQRGRDSRLDSESDLGKRRRGSGLVDELLGAGQNRNEPPRNGGKNMPANGREVTDELGRPIRRGREFTDELGRPIRRGREFVDEPGRPIRHGREFVDEPGRVDKRGREQVFDEKGRIGGDQLHGDNVRNGRGYEHRHDDPSGHERPIHPHDKTDRRQIKSGWDVGDTLPHDNGNIGRNRKSTQTSEGLTTGVVDVTGVDSPRSARISRKSGGEIFHPNGTGGVDNRGNFTGVANPNKTDPHKTGLLATLGETSNTTMAQSDSRSSAPRNLFRKAVVKGFVPSSDQYVPVQSEGGLIGKGARSVTSLQSGQEGDNHYRREKSSMVTGGNSTNDSDRHVRVGLYDRGDFFDESMTSLLSERAEQERKALEKTSTEAAVAAERAETAKEAALRAEAKKAAKLKKSTERDSAQVVFGTHVAEQQEGGGEVKRGGSSQSRGVKIRRVVRGDDFNMSNYIEQITDPHSHIRDLPQKNI